ncbi:hypothetical protein [Zhihengliuella flava]|uniref:THIF-type NAD/FAD binding fold domain-containing protein n=1 Tax=Zhihengliuella flava TaxID=1285193 RepID=A0A931DAR2_9MICC|nr:hypothetical protein [Zhihengliuella flava]MBG6085582.1 hypothetical protein [Zhihengliuella flava]
MNNVTALPPSVETGACPLAFSGSRRRINPGLRLTSPTPDALCLGRGDRGFWLTGIDDADREYIARLAAVDTQVGYPTTGAPLPETDRCLELDALMGPLLVTDGDYRLPGVAADVLAADVADWSLAYGVHAGPTVQRRRDAVVRVTHLGRAGQHVAHLLATAGVGTLLFDDSTPTSAADLAAGYLRVSDLGRSRQAALLHRFETSHPHTRVFSGADETEADLTVAFPRWPFDEDVSVAQTQLPIRFGDAEAVLGPLVIPGATPCLACALGTRPAGDPAEHPGEITLAASISALAATHALMVVDRINAPATLGHELVLDLATGATRLEPVTSPAPASSACTCAQDP